MASIERTAYPRFKRFMSVRELHVFYTPQPDEIVWAREVAGSDEHLLALAILLKAFNRLGYFPGAPPRFRTDGPIRSVPERRGINARAAQKVHA